MILVDLELSRRLEAAEGNACAEFVEARRRLIPGSNAAVLRTGSVMAAFDGTNSPITQTFGLGMGGLVNGKELDEIETFYVERGASVIHEVSPIADPSVLTILNERGYHPSELSSIMYMPLAGKVLAEDGRNPQMLARLIRPEDAAVWARTFADGWRGETEFSDSVLELSEVMAARENALNFVAELNGEPVAAASLFVHGGVALMAGASTVPAARKQGAQRALIDARIRHAIEAGCDLMMMGAAPGSGSQRNAQRGGFSIAYTRIKWQKG